MKRALTIGLLSALICGTLAVPPAHASHHLVFITEVFLGTGGAFEAQFVELTAYSSGQTFVEGSEIVLYGTNGNELVREAFQANAGTDFDQPGESLLIATTAAETLFGVTADLEFDAQEIPFSGQACFESPTFDFVSCVSWGEYTGDDRGFGRPEHPSEGIPSGASIVRTKARGIPGQYDGLDDSFDSRDDFTLASPRPAGGGNPSATVQRIGFTKRLFNVAEADTDVTATIVRDNATNTDQSVLFSAKESSAKAPGDFQKVTEKSIDFLAGAGQKTEDVTIVDNQRFEGIEFVSLALREPTDEAVLGDRMNARIRIDDIDDDKTPPKSQISRPAHGASYAQDNLDQVKGTASDPAPGKVDEVAVKIRKNMKDGTCRWWNGQDAWINRSCGASSAFLEATGAKNWSLSLPVLEESVGTNVLSYTVISIAQDGAGNDEATIKAGRNKSTFEVH